jgi:hypothetical protein
MPEHDHEQEHGRPVTEEDRISTGSVLFVGIGSLVVFFLASFAATGYLKVKVGERPVVPLPAEVGQSKIGLVEQQMFGLADRGERERTAKLRQLRSWGWIDRDRGIVHMPIERAMELTVEGVRPPPGPIPPPAPKVGG